MPKPKLPVISANEGTYPKKALCPRCGKRKVFEPHSFAAISGGAVFGRLSSRNAGPDPRMKGYLDFTWHGAHDSGVGPDRDIYVCAKLVEGSEDGQFQMYFCSPKCLRTFLNDCVDELEARIKNPERGRRRKVDPLLGI